MSLSIKAWSAKLTDLRQTAKLQICAWLQHPCIDIPVSNSSAGYIHYVSYLIRLPSCVQQSINLGSASSSDPICKSYL